MRPVRAERIRRHETLTRPSGTLSHPMGEGKHARVLQPFLHLARPHPGPLPRGEGIAGLEHPFIEPHLHPVRPQPLRQRAHLRLVLRAVAEENVALKFAGHTCFA